MDTITHGIAGALVGKGFFAERYRRVATVALTVGAVFPDCDVLIDAASSDPMALLRYHRGITHSFLGLPFFAVGLAGLTRWYARRRGLDCPSWFWLAVMYAAGIASHILLDGFTSFGTRMWTPLSTTRVSWDWLFIIDFLFTGIVLLPQVAAWVYREREAVFPRALRMWALFSLLSAGIFGLARLLGVGFAPWGVVVLSVLLAGLFFLPAWRGWGFRVRRASWCRAGAWLAAAYLAACGVAHHAALGRMERFAAAQGLPAGSAAAIPAPPSLLNWGGMVRAAGGAYQARFSLVGSQTPAFEFFADSPPNRYIAAALELPSVKTYLGFARFPLIRYRQQGEQNVVELSDLRFFGLPHHSPRPFTYRVVLDRAGKLVWEGWALE